MSFFISVFKTVSQAYQSLANYIVRNFYLYVPVHTHGIINQTATQRLLTYEKIGEGYE